MTRLPLFVCTGLYLACCFLGNSAHGDNWPGWRGPTGQGVSPETNLPVTWSTTENVRWKVQLPDAGNSSPIVWGDRVFLTQASEKTLWPPQRLENSRTDTSIGGNAVAEKRSVICIQRATGDDVWKEQIQQRPGTTETWGSMVHSVDKLYFTDQHGTTLVLTAGPKYEVLALNKLDEHTNASIAVSQGDIFIRTYKHLWCIGNTSDGKDRTKISRE